MAITKEEYAKLLREAQAKNKANEALHKQQAQQLFQELQKNQNVIEGVAHGAKTGVNQLRSGVESAGLGVAHTVTDFLGMDEKVNELENALRASAQKQAQRQAEINSQYDTNFGGFARVASDTTAGAIGMAPTVAAFMLTPQGKVAAASKGVQWGSKALGFAPLAAQSAGGGINQALNEGANVDEAKKYGALSAVKEVATELPFAGIGKVPALINAGQKLAGGNAIARGAVNMATEGAEEAMSEYIDPYIQRATYNPNAENASIEDMLYSALIGGLVTGGINTGLSGAGKVANMALGGKKVLPTAQNQGESSQNAQDGSRAQIVDSTIKDIRDQEKGSYTKFSEDEKTRNQLLEEETRLLEQKRALEQQKAQMERAQREQAEMEIQNLEQNVKSMGETKSPAFDNALFTAMDEYTTPETKAPKAELPMAARNLDNVKDKNVKAYQSTHPEVKAFFREQAEILLNDLNNQIDGGREYGFDPETRNVTTVRSQTRLASSPIESLMQAGMTKDQIRDGLERIIRDNGAENTINAKRVETVLDDSLANGYQSMQGRIPKNLDYAYRNANTGQLQRAYDALNTEDAFANARNTDELISEMEYLEGRATEGRQLIEAYSELLPNMSVYENMTAEELHNEMSKLENASQYAPDEIAGEMMNRHRYLEQLEEGRVNEFIENEGIREGKAALQKQLEDKKLQLKLPKASDEMRNIQRQLEEVEAKQAGVSIFSKVNYDENGNIDLETSIVDAPVERPEYTDYDLSKLSEDVVDFYEMVNRVGGKFGFRVRIVDGLDKDTANGIYDGEGTILLDGNKMIDESTISRVIGHEVYHFLKNTDEHKYIIDLALEGKDKVAEILRKFEAYAEHDAYYLNPDGTIDVDAYLDEIGAEYIEGILSDPAVAERIWNENPTLAERIVNFFEDIIDYIRSAVKGTSSTKKALDAYSRGLRNMQQQQAQHGGSRFSIARTDKGEPVVKIESNIFADNMSDDKKHKIISDYIKSHIGDMHTLVESGQKVYIGDDLPMEFTQSASTERIKKANRWDVLNAKNQSIQNIGELIEIAANRNYSPNEKNKHDVDAKYGWYHYDTRFAVKEGKKWKAYTAELLIRNDSNGKKYLYDMVKIKKDSSSKLASTHEGSAMVDGRRPSREETIVLDSLPQNQKKNNSKSLSGKKTRYSLPDVEPIQPSSDKWKRSATFEEVKTAHPTLFELDSGDTEKANPTQISTTVKTYRNIYNTLKREGFDGKILDASSGKGYGTRAGIDEYGFDVDDIEPFPGEKYKPKYTDYSSLDEKYDVIISNAVLNVLTQDLRDSMVVTMGNLLKDGGRMFINVRGADVKNATTAVAIDADALEYFIADDGSYQKGFRLGELKAYLQDVLGDGYSIERPKGKENQFGSISYIVTKTGDSNKRYSIPSKEQQLSVIQNSNPMLDDYHTGIRSVDDILTFEEALQEDVFAPDYTREDAQNALRKGSVTVYSSNPISQGVFVTPSKMEAQSYSGDGRVYSKEVSLGDVAWIDSLEGQYAKVDSGVSYDAQDSEFSTVDVRNKKGDVVARQRGGNIRFNIDTFENSDNETYGESGEDVLRKYVDSMVKKGKMDKGFGDSVIEQLGETYKMVKSLTTGKNADKFSYFTAWSEVKPVFDEEGRLVLSVATPNGEYPMNLDFSTRCAKRVAIDTLLMHMSASGIYNIADLTPSDFAMINQILQDNQLATACTMCFVETKRDKSAGWANTIADEYNELLEAANIQNGKIDERSLAGKRKEMAERKENATSMAMSERYVEYFRANANNPIQLQASDLMHSSGMERVKREAPDIYSIASSRYGAGTPKPLTAEGAYVNELLRTNVNKTGGKKKKPHTWKPEEAFKVGGVRLQSFSDFRVEMFFDYCQMIADAAVKGLPVQSYTKVETFAKLFGMTGIKINMSLVPEVMLTEEERAYIDSLSGKSESQKRKDKRFLEIQSRAGLSTSGSYLWAKESFDPETAYNLQDDDRYTDNVGTVAIGVSDAQIWKMLKDKKIRMIIPYHKSGIDAVVARAKNIDIFKNYENCQNHMIIDPKLTKMPSESYAQYYRRLATYDKYGSKPAKKEFNFDFYGALKKLNDPVAVSKKYVEECQKRNIAPKFPQFVYDKDGSFNKDYYKLLIDFTVYNKNGKYVKQEAVKFDADHMPSDWRRITKNALKEDQTSRDDMNAKIEGVAREVVQRLDSGVRHSFEKDVKTYGAFPKGENPTGTNRDIDVPQQTADDNRVSRFVRTAVESSNVDDVTVGMIERDMEQGRFVYEPTGNKKQIGRANRLIEQKGWSSQVNAFKNKYDSGERMTADDIVLGERLIQEAQSHGDYATAVDLIADVAALGTELGQAVQALSVLKRLTPQGKVQALKRVEARINSGLAEQNKGAVKIPNELLEQMLQTESVQMQADIWDKCMIAMAEQSPATLADKVNAWRYLAMLSNPKTHIRNFVGNSVMRGVSALKRGIQNSLENRLLTAEEERLTTLNRNVPAEYIEFAKWVWDDEGRVRAEASGGRYNDAISIIERNKKIFKNDKLESWRKGNEGALFGADMMFKEGTFVNALARYMYANNLKPSMLQDKASLASYEKGVEYALLEADKATFQEASKMAQLLSQIEHSSPAAQVAMGAVFPFKKTPINILKRGVEYSPVGLMNGLYKMRHDVQNGNMTKAEAIDAISAGLTGTAIMALGCFMASLGMISAGEDEDDSRKQWYDQSMGSQNYALVLPNGATATIDWMAPAVMPLMAGAELYKQLTAQNPDNDNSTAVTVMLESIMKVANPVLEMSMLQGLTDTLKSYNQGTAGVLSDLGTSMLSSYGGQFIPAPVGALTRTIDDTVRSSYAPKDSMLTKEGEKFLRQQANKLPVASAVFNEPSMDIWGNPREREGGNIIGRAFNNFINPATYSSNKKTELDYKLDELYEATGNSGVYPKSGAQYINSTETTPKVQLNHKEYARYGTVQGQKSRQYVESFVNSYEYNQIPNNEKAEIISDLYGLAEYQAKKEVLNARGYNYADEKFEKVLRSQMNPQDYYVVKYNVDVIAENTTEGEKDAQIAYLRELKLSGVITDEQFWYLRRVATGKKFNTSEMASCPYDWIVELNG